MTSHSTRISADSFMHVNSALLHRHFHHNQRKIIKCTENFLIITSSGTQTLILAKCSCVLSILSTYKLIRNQKSDGAIEYWKTNHIQFTWVVTLDRILSSKDYVNELKSKQTTRNRGDTLGRILFSKEYVNKLKSKLTSRNNFLSKLTNTSWGADPKTMKQTALALCYFTPKYCLPEWARLFHKRNVC